MKCCDFIVGQVPGLQGVVQGIVQSIGIEFIILHQLMVWPGRKEQRRQKQGIDGGANTSRFDSLADVMEVVIKDIVSAHVLRAFEKLDKLRDGTVVKIGPIFPHTTDVLDLATLRLDFCVDECDGTHRK